MTDSREIENAAFLAIQGSKELYKAWCDAKSYDERTLMLIEQAYDLGMKQGIQRMQDSGADNEPTN